MYDDDHHHHLDAPRLAQLIQGEILGDAADDARHIETCADCRKQMEEMAAGQDWWLKAQCNLSDFELIDSTDMPGTSSVVATRTELSYHHSGSSFDVKQILDEPSHPEMLGRLDQYEIERVLGRGGMGVVFKGLDRELNRAVAIKIMSPHLAYNGTARKRFEREARAAAAVVHPHVIPIHGVDSTRQHPYIVMPMIAGQSLQAYVDENGPFELKEIVRIARQIAAGLAAAHDQGLIHRDIKPANILMEQDISRVVITDFGLARAADDVAMTQTGWLAGTPHYMSPEQARGTSVDCRSDLFSLGSLMFFMATGREPFRAEKPVAVLHKICSDEPLPVRQLNEDLSTELEDIIEKLLEKKPSERFQNATEVEKVLEVYLSFLQHPLSTRPPFKIRTRRNRQRKKRIIMIGTSVCAAIALFVAASIYGAFRPADTNASLLGDSAAGFAAGAAAEQVQNEGDIPPMTGDVFPQQNLMSEDEFNREMQLLSNGLDSLESLIGNPQFTDPNSNLPYSQPFDNSNLVAPPTTQTESDITNEGIRE